MARASVSYVQKNSYVAAAPLLELLCVFGEDGNAHLWELRGDFAYAESVCPNRRVGQQNVCRAALACHKQFERGGALEIANATRDEHAQGVAELGGFDVRAPAIRITAE